LEFTGDAAAANRRASERRDWLTAKHRRCHTSDADARRNHILGTGD
jgi:hypothetical protein